MIQSEKYNKGATIDAVPGGSQLNLPRLFIAVSSLVYTLRRLHG